MSLWIGASFAIMISTVLLADGQRNLIRLVDYLFAPQPGHSEPIKTSRVSIRVRDEASTQPTSTWLLMSTPTTEIGPLVRYGDPQERCAGLMKPGYEQPRYFVTDEFFQCTAMFIDGEEEKSPSIFIQIRTDPSGEVSSFRLKFNTAGTDAQKLIQAGLNALQRFGGFAQTDAVLLTTLASRVQKWENFGMLWGHYSLEMKQEIADAARFNLIGRSNSQSALGRY